MQLKIYQFLCAMINVEVPSMPSIHVSFFFITSIHVSVSPMPLRFLLYCNSVVCPWYSSALIDECYEPASPHLQHPSLLAPWMSLSSVGLLRVCHPDVTSCRDDRSSFRITEHQSAERVHLPRMHRINSEPSFLKLQAITSCSTGRIVFRDATPS